MTQGLHVVVLCGINEAICDYAGEDIPGIPIPVFVFLHLISFHDVGWFTMNDLCILTLE
jgi:hypothetical protein